MSSHVVSNTYQNSSNTRECAANSTLCINSNPTPIFLSLRDDNVKTSDEKPSKKTKGTSSLISTWNIYNPKVKVTNWQYEQEAQPKDYDPYKGWPKDYSRSTYNRIQDTDRTFPKTTTQEMLEQVWTKPDTFQYLRRPLVNLVTQHTTDADLHPCRSEKLWDVKIPKHPPDYYNRSFISETMDEFRPPRPYYRKTEMVPDVTPWIKYRKCFSDLPPDPTKHMEPLKFWDEGIKTKCTCRDSKKVTFKSYNPYTSQYSQ